VKEAIVGHIASRTTGEITPARAVSLEALAHFVACVTRDHLLPLTPSSPARRPDEEHFRPSSSLARIVRYSPVLAYCMLLDSRRVNPGVGNYSNSDSASQWMEASDGCAEEIGYYDPMLSDGQLAELYEQEVTEHDCLTALGHPSDEPPTAQTFVESYGSATQYFAIAGVLEQRLPEPQTKEITAECPPPTWFLNVAGI
jgi:hypothetical protein